MKTTAWPLVAVLIAGALTGAYLMRRPSSVPPADAEVRPQTSWRERVVTHDTGQDPGMDDVAPESSASVPDDAAGVTTPAVTADEARERLAGIHQLTRDRGTIPKATWDETSHAINAAINSRPAPFGRPDRGATTFPPDDATMAALRQAAVDAADPSERIASLALLSSLPSEQPYVDVLAQALFDPEIPVPVAATEELAWLDDDEWNSADGQNAIERALTDPAPEVPREALRVLGDMDPEQIANNWPLVEAALHDTDEEARALAESVVASAS